MIPGNHLFGAAKVNSMYLYRLMVSCIQVKKCIQGGKFKKNVTVQFFYPHALNMEYFYLNLSLKGVL